MTKFDFPSDLSCVAQRAKREAWAKDGRTRRRPGAPGSKGGMDGERQRAVKSRGPGNPPGTPLRLRQPPALTRHGETPVSFPFDFAAILGYNPTCDDEGRARLGVGRPVGRRGNLGNYC